MSMFSLIIFENTLWFCMCVRVGYVYDEEELLDDEKEVLEDYVLHFWQLLAKSILAVKTTKSVSSSFSHYI